MLLTDRKIQILRHENFSSGAGIDYAGTDHRPYEALVEAGLLRKIPHAHKRWTRYLVTDLGMQVLCADALMRGLSGAQRES
jgi:hypothetical protein